MKLRPILWCLTLCTLTLVSCGRSQRGFIQRTDAGGRYYASLFPADTLTVRPKSVTEPGPSAEVRAILPLTRQFDGVAVLSTEKVKWEKVGMSRPDSEAVKAKADTLLPPTAPKTELGAKHRLNGFAAGSLVAGLGGLILPFYVSYAFLILAVAAVGLGILALLKLKKRPRQWGRGLAVVGTVMGLVVSILILLILTRPSGE